MRSVSGHRLNNDIEKVHAQYGLIIRAVLTLVSKRACCSHRSQRIIIRYRRCSENHSQSRPNSGHFTKQGTIESLLAKLIWAAPNLLTTTDKAAHKRLRTTLQPAFTAKALMEQEDIVQHHVNKTVETLGAALKGEKIVNISDHFARMIWSVVGDLSFGEPLLHDQMSTLRREILGRTQS
ncbi:cytochrome P450 monooxygenase ATR14 [Colletotrichum liriopes]|uniref:Cytochrome P450 monooxygenase ATR14 n=1 Tax=Colletotrichum liriopes TaxID=708192 RepID=A0AA37LPU6_9PEZI|nr:cytochrome P450 monooxygenase ATR14 [Colletotrichum liriopes]